MEGVDIKERGKRRGEREPSIGQPERWKGLIGKGGKYGVEKEECRLAKEVEIKVVDRKRGKSSGQPEKWRGLIGKWVKMGLKTRELVGLRGGDGW